MELHGKMQQYQAYSRQRKTVEEEEEIKSRKIGREKESK